MLGERLRITWIVERSFCRIAKVKHEQYKLKAAIKFGCSLFDLPQIPFLPQGFVLQWLHGNRRGYPRISAVLCAILEDTRGDSLKLIKWMAAVLLTGALLLGCAQDKGADPAFTPPSVENNQAVDVDKIQLLQLEEPKSGDTIATIETTQGSFEVVLYPQRAPKAVENFTAHVNEGYYNGLKIFEIVKDNRIQTGDPNNDGTGGDSIWGGPFEDEFGYDLWHFTGAVCMVSTGADSNRSQFYVVCSGAVPEETVTQMEEAKYPQKVIDAYKEKGGAPWHDSKTTVFGQVVGGMDVVQKICNLPQVENTPKEDVIVTNITLRTVE